MIIIMFSFKNLEFFYCLNYETKEIIKVECISKVERVFKTVIHSKPDILPSNPSYYFSHIIRTVAIQWTCHQ